MAENYNSCRQVKLQIIQCFHGILVATKVVILAAARVAAGSVGDVGASLAVKAFTAALHVPYPV